MPKRTLPTVLAAVLLAAASSSAHGKLFAKHDRGGEGADAAASGGVVVVRTRSPPSFERRSPSAVFAPPLPRRRSVPSRLTDRAPPLLSLVIFLAAVLKPVGAFSSRRSTRSFWLGGGAVAAAACLSLRGLMTSLALGGGGSEGSAPGGWGSNAPTEEGTPQHRSDVKSAASSGVDVPSTGTYVEADENHAPRRWPCRRRTQLASPNQ